MLIGLIDVGGFDFAHPDFLHERASEDDAPRTRFVAIWDQGGGLRGPPLDPRTGETTPMFDYGSVIGAKHMDAALAAAHGGAGAPAWRLEPQSVMRAGSHGTHVASIAAGNGGVCPDALIAGVVVDIPELRDSRLSFYDTSRIVHAVEWLAALAETENAALSINVSLATNGHAHDASSAGSRWLDAILATPGRAICVAAGNSGQESPTTDGDLGWMMGRIHAEGRIPGRDLTHELEWLVIGNGAEDMSENELEIWYGAQDRISVRIRTPDGRWFPPFEGPDGPIEPGVQLINEPVEFEIRDPRSGQTVRRRSFVTITNDTYHRANGANRIAIYLSPDLKQIHGVMPGRWLVRLYGDRIRDGSFKRLDRAGRPRPHDARGDAPRHALPVLLLREEQQRPFERQLARMRAPRDLGRQSGPGQRPHPPEQQPGSHTGRATEARGGGTGHGDRRRPRLRKPDATVGRDDRDQHGEPVRLRRGRTDAPGEPAADRGADRQHHARHRAAPPVGGLLVARRRGVRRDRSCGLPRGGPAGGTSAEGEAVRLRIVQSREGDALILSRSESSAQGTTWTHVLIDGGRAAAYRESMREALQSLERSHDETAGDGPNIDLLVVSHIDSDHIEGVLRYADDLVEWRVFDYRSGRPEFADRLDELRPAFVRPPAPRAAWHNSFEDLLDDGDAGDGGGLSSAAAAMFGRLAARFDPPSESERSAAAEPGSSLAAADVYGLEASEKQAHQLSERLGPEQLGIPLNVPANGARMQIESVPDAVTVGGMRLAVIGPSADDLEKLREKWTKWLETADAVLADIAEEAAEIERSLGHDEVDAVVARLRSETAPVLDPEALARLALAAGHDAELAASLGEAGRVSAPNHASLMLLATTEDGAAQRGIVLTGDGHHARILEGLEREGVLPANGEAHVDVLKVPHHGSKNNADEAFFRRVIADHYVFCGDGGTHHNPHEDIVQALIDARLGDDSERSPHPRAGDPFTLWFSTHPEHPSLATRNSAREQTEKIKAIVDRLVEDNPGRVTAHWSREHFIDLVLSGGDAGATSAGVVISRVLPNPAGTDAGNEWVEVSNRGTADVTLDAMHIEDRQGGRIALDGVLGAGETHRIDLPVPGPIRLSNAGDEVRLIDGTTELDRVSWTNAGSGEVLTFTPD